MSPDPSTVPSLTLYRGWPERTTYSWSPFVTKLEFHLRLSGVLYNSEAGSPLKAPKGKIPYVDLNPQGTPPSFLGDSGLIIKHLMRQGQIENLNGALSPEQKLQDSAIRALLEDKLYFYNMRERWLDNYYLQRDKALWSASYPMRVMVGLLIHRNTTATLHGQGTGRYSSEEITTFRREIWEDINDALGSVARSTDTKDVPFWVLGGSEPTEADASLFGFIVSVLVSTSCPESTRLVGKLPAVLDYAGRIHDKYFTEYSKWPVRGEGDENMVS